MAADLVGLYRRCPSLPRSAWYDQCPFSLFAVDGGSRVFGPRLGHVPPASDSAGLGRSYRSSPAGEPA
jgi:hypothetical protein